MFSQIPSSPRPLTLGTISDTVADLILNTNHLAPKEGLCDRRAARLPPR